MESGIERAQERDPADRRTRILLISDYGGLRFSRELLLRKHGYAVEVMSSSQFLEKKELCHCDLAILCQSLESDRALLIGAILRRTEPGTAQLRVHPFRRGLEPEFDLCVDGFDGPGVLLNVLQAFMCAHPKVI